MWEGKPLNEWERIENVLDRLPVDRPPVICPMHAATTALMKAATAYFPEVQDDPIKMARLAIATHDVAGFENVRVPFDETVETSAFGVLTGHSMKWGMELSSESWRYRSASAPLSGRWRKCAR
jgi:uroporphyrinogen-III decarboxylase